MTIYEIISYRNVEGKLHTKNYFDVWNSWKNCRNRTYGRGLDKDHCIICSNTYMCNEKLNVWIDGISTIMHYKSIIIRRFVPFLSLD